MTSMAVLAGLSLTHISAGVIAEILDGKNKQEVSEGFETVFTDSQMLYNTLTDYDCHVEKVSENEFLVDTVNGKLRYYSKDENTPFSIYFDRIVALLEYYNLVFLLLLFYSTTIVIF